MPVSRHSVSQTCLLGQCISLHYSMFLRGCLRCGLIRKSYVNGHILSFVLTMTCASFLPILQANYQDLWVLLHCWPVSWTSVSSRSFNVEVCGLSRLSWVCNQIRCCNPSCPFSSPIGVLDCAERQASKPSLQGYSQHPCMVSKARCGVQILSIQIKSYA